jgi:hypothetical protein
VAVMHPVLLEDLGALSGFREIGKVKEENQLNNALRKLVEKRAIW